MKTEIKKLSSKLNTATELLVEALNNNDHKMKERCIKDIMVVNLMLDALAS